MCNTSPKKNRAYIFSPCVILAIISLVIVCFYMLVPTERSEEGAYMILATLFLLPCLIISLLIDLIVRFCLKEVKKKAQYIWGIEAIVIVFVFGLFIFWVTL